MNLKRKYGAMKLKTHQPKDDDDYLLNIPELNNKQPTKQTSMPNKRRKRMIALAPN
jgi:hypothetical protein